MMKGIFLMIIIMVIGIVTVLVMQVMLVVILLRTNTTEKYYKNDTEIKEIKYLMRWVIKYVLLLLLTLLS